MGNYASSLSGTAEIAQSSAEIAIQGMKGETERYRVNCEQATEMERINLKKMEIFFTFVGAANAKTIDAIENIARGMFDMSNNMGDATAQIVKEYQVTIRSVSANLAECATAMGASIQHLGNLAPGIQELVFKEISNQIQTVITNLQSIAKLMIGLANVRDKRFKETNEKLIESVNFTQKVLEDLCANKEDFKKLVFQTANNSARAIAS